MPGGRPTKYTPELLEAAHAYVDGGWKDQDGAIPSIAGLSDALGVTRKTLHEWAKDSDKPEFCDTLEKLLAKQEVNLLNKGLLGEFNPTMAKLALTNHGYSDKVETDNKHDVSDPLKELLGEIGNGKKTVGGD